VQTGSQGGASRHPAPPGVLGRRGRNPAGPSRATHDGRKPLSSFPETLSLKFLVPDVHVQWGTASIRTSDTWENVSVSALSGSTTDRSWLHRGPRVARDGTRPGVLPLRLGSCQCLPRSQSVVLAKSNHVDGSHLDRTWVPDSPIEILAVTFPIELLSGHRSIKH
jgi:hypothetical protein